MREEGAFDRRSPQEQAALISAVAEKWRIAVPAAGLWAMAAARKLPAGGPARWTLEYDPRMRLVSFEVWANGTCVFGIDDLIM